MAGKTKTPRLAGCAGVVAVGRSRGEADRRRLSGGSGEGVVGSTDWGDVVGLGVRLGSKVGSVGMSKSWEGKSCGVVALALAWARASLSS